MKYKCKWCHCEVEISQSEKAKTGMKKLEDHEGDCFRKRHPTFERIMERVMADKTPRPVPDKFDMQAIIKYLHESLGRIPNETQCLRFHMFLETNPSDKECEDFICLLLKAMG